jgi:thioredoxin-like negative regulator of GroEL
MASCNSDALVVTGDAKTRLAALKKLTSGSGSIPAIVFFYSPTCPHCQTLDEAFQRYRKQCFQQKADAILVIVNQQTSPELFQAYKVDSYPQVMVFKNGKRVNHVIGADLPALACAFRTAGIQIGPKPKESEK